METRKLCSRLKDFSHCRLLLCMAPYFIALLCFSSISTNDIARNSYADIFSSFICFKTELSQTNQKNIQYCEITVHVKCGRTGADAEIFDSLGPNGNYIEEINNKLYYRLSHDVVT